MERQYDLGAARAARAEARGEAPTLVIDGRTYNLAAEIPWSVVDEMIVNGGTETELGAKLLRLVFGDRWGEFLEREKPSAKDVEDLCAWLFEKYGLGSAKGGADPSSPSSPSESASTSVT